MRYDIIENLVEKLSCDFILADSEDPESLSGLLPVLKQIKYPDVENHRKLHDKFITDLNKISEEFSNESFDEFKTFLYTWLIDHILNEDNKYFIFSNHQKET